MAIGTLVERTTDYTMLMHLRDGYKPELVRDALAAKIQTLPNVLRASLTWNQGPEMRDWKQVSVDADIDIYFCDPHAPVAARDQREHQRTAAPVLSERQ
jgi:IS30 family transposase